VTPWRAGNGVRAIACAVLAVALATPAAAYLKFGFSDGATSRVLRWPDGGPVRYFVGDGDGPGVSAREFDEAVARAVASWQAVSTSRLQFTRLGVTSRAPIGNDGVTQLAFASRPDLDRTLASTAYTIDVRTAEILEVDIFFNTAFPWSTATSGVAGRFDVETIAVHEIGHLAGLGHSALGETERLPSGSRRLLSAAAVMFPIAFAPGNIDGRRLQPDDIAGVSDIYPTPEFRSRTGSVSGRVRLDGIGVFGAHVTALHLRTGAIVGGFTLDRSGTYVLAGLEAGPVVLRVEPLDDGDVESFLSARDVETSFRPAFFDRVVYVPAGGNAGNVDITVTRP